MFEEDFEREYLAEFAYLEAEKEHEEWLFWKEDAKFEKEKRAAKIKIKAEHDKDRIECAPVSGIS